MLVASLIVIIPSTGKLQLLAQGAQKLPEAVAGAEGFEPPLAVLETAGLPLNLRPYFNSSVLRRGPACRPLFDLLMRHVLTAERAELLQLQSFRAGLLVLHAGVVLALAITALKCNLLTSHI